MNSVLVHDSHSVLDSKTDAYVRQVYIIAQYFKFKSQPYFVLHGMLYVYTYPGGGF